MLQAVEGNDKNKSKRNHTDVVFTRFEFRSLIPKLRPPGVPRRYCRGGGAPELVKFIIKKAVLVRC